MITNKTTIITLGLVGMAVFLPAEENPLVEKIGGYELKVREAAEQGGSPEVKTRGFQTRGIQTRGAGSATVEVPPRVEAQKRTVIFSTRGIGEASTRGIAQAISATDSVAQGVEVKQIVAPQNNPYSTQGDLAAQPGETAYAVSYQVDPTSQLRGEIRFRKGSTEIADANSVQFITILADAINNPKLDGFRFVIEGHASAEGGAEANQRLSQRRANAIYDILTSPGYGVNGNRLLPVGYGESEARFPPSAGEHALSQDRRVMIYKLEH